MKYRRLTLTTIFLLLLAIRSSYAQSVAAPPAVKVQPVNYCELIRNSVAYDQKKIRVRAIYVVGFEAAYLYDPVCSGGAGGDIRAWVKFSETYEKSSDSKVKKGFHKLLKSLSTSPERQSVISPAASGYLSMTRLNENSWS